MGIDNSTEQQWRLLVLLLKQAAEEKGVTHEQLADATGFQRSNITRVFGLKYCPNLRTYLAIAKALDLNLFFETTDSNTELNVLFERAMDQLVRRLDNLPDN